MVIFSIGRCGASPLTRPSIPTWQHLSVHRTAHLFFAIFSFARSLYRTRRLLLRRFSCTHIDFRPFFVLFKSALVPFDSCEGVCSTFPVYSGCLIGVIALKTVWWTDCGGFRPAFFIRKHFQVDFRHFPSSGIIFLLVVCVYTEYINIFGWFQRRKCG